MRWCTPVPVVRDRFDVARDGNGDRNEGYVLLRQENEDCRRHDEGASAQQILAERTMRRIVVIDRRFAVAGVRRGRAHLMRERGSLRDVDVRLGDVGLQHECDERERKHERTGQSRMRDVAWFAVSDRLHLGLVLTAKRPSISQKTFR